MEKKAIELLAVIGPTASGKTGLSVKLANEFNGEIISCDSMQLYKSMPIATAVPTAEERCGIRHHMMEILEPEQSYSVKEYCEEAKKCIEDISCRNKLPILCGGTGLYYSSLTQGIAFSEISENPSLRKELEQRAAEQGGKALLCELSSFDPETAARLNPSDLKRIIRAIEVYRESGVAMSEHIRRSKLNPPEYKLCVIGLAFADRAKLYERINSRVDEMLKNGLLDEARNFYGRNAGATAAQAIGFKELRPYIEGNEALDTAVERLKMETRRYAKRQLTWFRRDKQIKWLFVDECGESLFIRAAELVREDMNV